VKIRQGATLAVLIGQVEILAPINPGNISPLKWAFPRRIDATSAQQKYQQHAA